jgi:hypothetical protein
VSRRKKVLLGLGITAVVVWFLWLPLALGLMAGFPFALWDDPVEAGVESVGARATFEESADCLRYWRDVEGRRLNDTTVADCFPTQTATKKKALVACFNNYERNHPDHGRWPEDNMRGCTWDGLTSVPVKNVASLDFGKVVAAPPAPRAGRSFTLRIGLTRGDSAEKIKQRIVDEDDNPALEVAVTIDGEIVPIETVEGCSPCRLSGEPASEYWFEEGEIWVKFPVPATAAGKPLAITMTAALHDTPTIRKVVHFTVKP